MRLGGVIFLALISVNMMMDNVESLTMGMTYTKMLFLCRKMKVKVSLFEDYEGHFWNFFETFWFVIELHSDTLPKSEINVLGYMQFFLHLSFSARIGENRINMYSKSQVWRWRKEWRKGWTDTDNSAIYSIYIYAVYFDGEIEIWQTLRLWSFQWIKEL